jgi:hypothetical protein
MATIRIALAALLALLIGARRRGRSRRTAVPTAVQEVLNETAIDPQTGAVRSRQALALQLRREALGEITSPAGIAWLGQTYWSFLRRVTLGLVRTRSPERSPTLMAGPLRLMSFGAPQFEAQPERGRVCWPIERGLLVARSGRDGRGHLQIALRRGADAPAELGWLELEVEVADFHPAIARLSRRLYERTQARIHVIVTRGYLRSLARRYEREPRAGGPGNAKARPLFRRGAARRRAGAASRGRGQR